MYLQSSVINRNLRLTLPQLLQATKRCRLFSSDKNLKKNGEAENRKDLVENGLLPADLPCITNSDAHDLAFIGENCGALSENNPLRKFIETL